MSRSRHPRRSWPRRPLSDEKRIEARRYRCRERTRMSEGEMPAAEPNWYRYNEWNWD